MRVFHKTSPLFSAKSAFPSRFYSLCDPKDKKVYRKLIRTQTMRYNFQIHVFFANPAVSDRTILRQSAACSRRSRGGAGPDFFLAFCFHPPARDARSPEEGQGPLPCFGSTKKAKAEPLLSFLSDLRLWTPRR